MIEHIPTDLQQLPFRLTDELCLGKGLLNPSEFRPHFRKYPWVPLEDTVFNIEQIRCLLMEIWSGLVVHRCTLPCRSKAIETVQISSGDPMDVFALRDWLAYDEGMVWTCEGEIIMNSYSDYVILGISRRSSLKLFQQDPQNLFSESLSIFKTSEEDEEIALFMSKIRQTWPSSWVST